MNKVFIFGGSGLVGFTLVKRFKENGWWVSTVSINREVKGADETILLDLSIQESLNELPDLHTFDLVVNSLAITDVKSNEVRFKDSFNLHVHLSRFIASKSRKYVYLSTVAVYSEILNPIDNAKIMLTNWYSKTKYFGEPNCRHLTLRINVIGLESLTKRSLLEWGYSHLAQNKVITGFENHYINPTLPSHVFDAIIMFWENQIEPGVYDLGSDKIFSKYKLLHILAEIMGKDNYLKKGRDGINDIYQITRNENTLIVNYEFEDYVFRYLEEIKRA